MTDFFLILLHYDVSVALNPVGRLEYGKFKGKSLACIYLHVVRVSKWISDCTDRRLVLHS